ncbi:hypothetical protein AB0K40_25485 [Nonomuraea bangladeshensis]|uniref:Transposase family protein n=1 Tax=Nonomuraea bangladeshensis TaxID=404385 RepID=A0ABV3H8U0_9ACTN
MLAVLGGATSLAQIARFVAGYDPDLRTRAGLPGIVRPTASTLGRLSARLTATPSTLRPAPILATLAACGPPATTGIPALVRTALTSLAVDGRTLPGQPLWRQHRASAGAIHHDTQSVVAQRQVEAKSDEILAFTPPAVPPGPDRRGGHADALHTQHDHAYHVIAAGDHYLFIVKGNQPTLGSSAVVGGASGS